MSGTPCAGCGAQLAAGWCICHECTLDLEFQLKRVPEVYGTVLATLQRRDARTKSEGSSGGKAGSVEPVNLSALDYVMTLQAVLTGWAAQIPATRPASREPHIIAAWMLRPATMRLIRGKSWAYDMAIELADALHPLARIVEQPQSRIDLGPCPTDCGGKIRAAAGATRGRCTQCGQEFNSAEQRQWMISEAWHVTAPLPQIVRALHSMDVFVAPKDAENWASRRKLIACVDGAGAKTYQLKQVYTVHQAMAAKKAKAKAAAEARKLLKAAA